MHNYAAVEGLELINSAKDVFDIEANSVLKLKERLGEDFIRAI